VRWKINFGNNSNSPLPSIGNDLFYLLLGVKTAVGFMITFEALPAPIWVYALFEPISVKRG
jgi:hypothetical protein